MSSEWDKLVKEELPHEKEEAEKTLAKSEEKGRYLPKYIQKEVKAVGGCWTYERIRLDKILGWEKTEEKQDSHTYKKGKEIVQTSSTTFEVRDKIGRFSGPLYYIMKMDENEIKDLEKYKELEKEVSDFLSEAQKKMGPKVAPALFRNNECVPYLLFGIPKISLIIGGVACGFMSIVSGMIILLLPLILLGVAGGALAIYAYRKKRANYLPLIEAYFEKIKEFEEKAREIRN